MQALLRYILENIVEHPEAIDIRTSENPYGFVTIDFSVHQEDMGRVIGKSGKVIDAIRKVLKVKAIKQGIRLQLNLIELP